MKNRAEVAKMKRLKVLIEIQKQPGIRTILLTKTLLIGAIGAIVSKLKAEGLIESVKDGLYRNYTITEKGISFLEKNGFEIND